MTRRVYRLQPTTLDDEANARITRLFLEEHHAVKAALRRFGIFGSAADDLCQEVFVRLLYAGPVSAGWLFETARRIASNYRRLHVHSVEVLDNRAVENAAAPYVDADKRLGVLRVLGRLAKDEREVLEDYALDGSSLRELAACWRISKAGAHVRVEQARQQFRVFYAADGEADLGGARAPFSAQPG